MTLTQDYQPVEADAQLEGDCRQLVRLAVAEDIGPSIDWTTECLVAPEVRGEVEIRTREAGVAAGLVALPWILDEMQADVEVEVRVRDGAMIDPGDRLAKVRGNARALLTSERIVLNFLCRLSGIATTTSHYATAIEGTPARLYDTRKTTPGWRRLEKYAVRCGGGYNHRSGLFDGFLIKDNHLALASGEVDLKKHPRRAVEMAVQWAGQSTEGATAPEIIEVEVDGLAQLEDVLSATPHIVLLDNFDRSQLLEAVAMRDRLAPEVQLEASGGITLDTIRAIALTGVDRISSGAITHAARWLDLGMDWS